MKLQRVNLARAMMIGRMQSGELIAKDDLTLEADMDRRVIWINGDTFIPFEAVNMAQKADPDVPCPECKKMFTNLQALGAHRQKAHGYRGAGGGEAA